MTYKQINGVIPILQTPFDNQGRIDTDGLRKVVEFNIEAGVDGIGIALASEVQLFNESERDELLSTVVDQTNRRVPVVMNTEPSEPISPSTTANVPKSLALIA